MDDAYKALFNGCVLLSPLRTWGGSRRTVGLFGVDGLPLSGPPHPPHLTTASQDQPDPDLMQVVFPMSGRLELRTSGRETSVWPPDFVVCNGAEPITDGSPPAGAPLVIHVFRARLPIRAKLIDRLIGRSLPGDRGIGAILRGYVVGLTGRLAECQPADATRLASITLDLLSATLVHHADSLDQGSPRVHQRHLRERIDDFIQQNLGNRNLCPDLVATEHHISLRYLYRLFEDEELSVASTIRRRRLERCRADLAAPGMRTRSIHAIANRWGFSDAAKFSHAFRQVYGMSPSGYRSLTMTADPPVPYDPVGHLAHTAPL